MYNIVWRCEKMYEDDRCLEMCNILWKCKEMYEHQEKCMKISLGLSIGRNLILGLGLAQVWFRFELGSGLG